LGRQNGKLDTWIGTPNAGIGHRTKVDQAKLLGYLDT
jgi:hypothetical protein